MYKTKILFLLFFSSYLFSGQIFQFGARNISFSPSNRYIAFTSWNDKGLFLYEILKDTVITVSKSPGAGRYYRFSFDGNYLLFKEVEILNGDMIQRAVRFDLKSFQKEVLFEAPVCGNPSQSIDGTIAYTVQNKLHLEKGGTKNVIELDNYANLAPLSPDGKWVVFNSDEDQLFILDLETGKRRRISSDDVGAFEPIISPSGKYLVFTRADEKLEIVDLIGSERFYIDRGRTPQFLQNEKGIVFSRIYSKGYVITRSEIWYFDLTSKREHYICGGETELYAYPALTSDCSFIAFVELSSGDIILAEFDAESKRVGRKRRVVNGYEIPTEEASEVLMAPTRALVELAVPYMHQLYDTPDWFDGNWSCGPTSCVMAVQYYRKLPDHDITCSSPYPHISHWGWYIPNLYSYNGYTYDVWGIAPSGWVQGAHGFICRELGAAYWSYMIQFMNQHTLSSSQFAVNWSLFCAEIDLGYPVVASTTTLGYGHIQCFKGYEPNHVIISNDPYGNANIRPWGQYNGSGARYDWPGYNNGHVVLGISALFKARGEGGGPPPPPSTVSVTITTNFGGGTVIVDGTSYSAPYNAEWASGSTHTISVQSPQTTGGIRYVFERWSDGGAQTHSVSPTSATTYTAYFQRQYRLIVQASPSQHDSPNPAYGEHWYNAGSSITCSVVSPCDQEGWVRWRTSGWLGSGSVPSSGAGSSVSFVLNEPSTITWLWVRQFYLRLTYSNTEGHIPVQTGEGWWDANSRVNISTNDTIHDERRRYIFEIWQPEPQVPIDNQQSNNTAITLTQPSSIDAIYRIQYKCLVKKEPCHFQGELIIDRDPYFGYEQCEQWFWWDKFSQHLLSVTPRDSIGDTVFVFDHWSDYLPISHTTTPLMEPFDFIAYYHKLYFCKIFKVPCEIWGSLFLEGTEYSGVCSLSWWARNEQRYLIGTSPYDLSPDTLYIFREWAHGSFEPHHLTPPIMEPTTFYANYIQKYYYLQLYLRNPHWYPETLSLGSTRRMSGREGIEIINMSNIQVDLGLQISSTADNIWQPGVVPEFNTFSLRARFEPIMEDVTYYSLYNDLVTSSVKWADERTFGSAGFDIMPCFGGNCVNYLYLELKVPTGVTAYRQLIKLTIIPKVSLP